MPLKLPSSRQTYCCLVGGNDTSELRWQLMTVEHSMAINVGLVNGLHSMRWRSIRYHPTERDPEDDSKPLSREWAYEITLSGDRITQKNLETGAERRIEKANGGTSQGLLKPNDSWDDETADEIECIHVTPKRNLESIRATGLDPSFGGRGGSCETLDPNSPRAVAFKNHSQGKIHMTRVHPFNAIGPNTESDKGAFYAEYVLKNADPVKLHVYAADADLEEDPDDDAPGRVRTEHHIDAHFVSESRYESMSETDPSKVAIKESLNKLYVNIEQQIANHIDHVEDVHLQQPKPAKR